LIRIILVIFISLFILSWAYASVDDLTRAACDPPDRLIYPQQIKIGPDGNYYILDTVSNSSHIKIYTQDGEFISGLVPAGTGRNAAKFDLGLTLVSGKQIFDIDKNGILHLVDSEDGLSVIKSFDQKGTMITAVYMGYQNEDSAYGSLALDGENVYTEYDNQILFGKLPLNKNLVRFAGDKSDPIDNWTASAGNLVILKDLNLTVYNDSAIPVRKIDLKPALGNPLDVDIFNLAVNSSGEIAITGAINADGENEKAFLSTIGSNGILRKTKFLPKYIYSMDYGYDNQLYCMTIEDKSITLSKYAFDLTRLQAISIPTGSPALIHPRRITASSGSGLWVDDQYDAENYRNPFDVSGNMSLYLKNYNNGWKDILIKNLESDRYASLFLGAIGDEIIMSGLEMNQEGDVIENALYTLNTNTFDITNHSSPDNVESVVDCSISQNKSEVYSLNIDKGTVSIGSFENGKIMPSGILEYLAVQNEGLPVIMRLDEKRALTQAMVSQEKSLQMIMKIDPMTGKTIDKWNASEYLDLRLMYKSGSTCIVYWFPNALLKVDGDFKILAWIDLMNEVSYDFLDGVFLDSQNYILDGRYNTVYTFPDSSWGIMKSHTESEVIQSINYIRDSLAIFYSRYDTFPETLSELVRSGISGEDDLVRSLDSFLGQSPLFYTGNKFGYKMIIWTKDYNQTLYDVSSDGVEKIPE
jgi:hypothetical protein